MRDVSILSQGLTEPLPSEALIADPSRGQLILIGFKNAYVIERLNETFGLCGYGWVFTNSPFTISDDGKWMHTRVALQYRLYEESDAEPGGFPPCFFTQEGQMIFTNSPSVWSYPIVSSGGQIIVKGRMVDAQKGAVSSGIAKGASILGVGSEAYKGKYSYEDGTIVESDTGQNPFASAIDVLVLRLARSDKDGIEILRKQNRLINESFNRVWVEELINMIKTNDLSQYFKDNFELIAGRDCEFSDLTAAEIHSIGVVISSIVTGEVDIGLATELLPSWDRGTSWLDHVEASTTVKEEVVEIEDGKQSDS